MSAPQPSANEVPSGRGDHRQRWDALGVIIASMVGLLALVVSGYTAYIQRQQVRAQVWPYLEYSTSNVPPHTELDWLNKGVGPAIVRNVTVALDGKAQPDWNGVWRTLAVTPPNHLITSSLNGMVISPGETVRWLSFLTPADMNAFVVAKARAHMHVTVCYCSTLGECWRTEDSRNTPKPVQQCPSIPVSQQFEQ